MLELPDKSPAVWNQFFRENKPLVFKYVVKQIHKGIKQGLPKVDLIKFTQGSTFVDADNYLYMLQSALQVFVRAEEYEWAAKTQTIINTHYIEKVIQESESIGE
jgi:hypothetical protein